MASGLLSINPLGQEDFKASAVPGLGFHRQFTPDGAQPLSDHERAFSSCLEFGQRPAPRKIKTPPVIVNLEFPLAPCRRKVDLRLLRPAMLANVEKRFLKNEHHLTADLGWQGALLKLANKGRAN